VNQTHLNSLLSSGAFLSEYRSLGCKSKITARNLILRTLKKMYGREVSVSVQDRFELQTALNRNLGYRQPVAPTIRFDGIDAVEDFNDHAGEAVGNQEPPVSKKFIETITFVNGQNVATMSNDQVVGLIKQKTDAIQALDALPVKTKSIEAAIVAQKLELDQLVATLDAAFDANNGKPTA
jgi:hypothetical protein